MPEQPISTAAIEKYLRDRPRWVRWLVWARGRRYATTRFAPWPRPVVVVAYSFRDAVVAAEFAAAVERDWSQVPDPCRQAYDEILFRAPGFVVAQLRRTNVCGCLGHRHVVVKEGPFVEPHEALGGESCAEVDIAFERVKAWQPLPLSDTALDTKFLSGSRLEEFHAVQFRLRLLSVLLHEVNHWVFPFESEASVRKRSLAFYRDALASYVENTLSTLSLTIDRSFSRLG